MKVYMMLTTCFFPNRTTVSVLCPNFKPKVASIIGLYRVPAQCTLHSNGLTTIADRQKTVTLTKETLLLDIDVTLPHSSPPLKINRLIKKRGQVLVSDPDISWTTYVLVIIPTLVTAAVAISIVFHMYRKTRSFRIVKHVSASP